LGIIKYSRKISTPSPAKGPLRSKRPVAMKNIPFWICSLILSAIIGVATWLISAHFEQANPWAFGLLSLIGGIA
jgi:hypothetical protein